MRRQIYFCKSWFAAKKVATDVWTEAQAKAAHEEGRTYTVLVDSVERPGCAIIVGKKSVVVNFLDENLREALSYHFQDASPGRFFITMAIHREYEGMTDRVTHGTSYIFTRDGNVQIRREFFVPAHRLETAKTQADVSSNYATAPLFGMYEDFMQKERLRGRSS